MIHRPSRPRQSATEEMFHGQFLLSRKPMGAPPGFSTAEFDGWCLQTHHGLPVHDLCDPTGEKLGFVLGCPIIGQRVLDRSDRISIPPPGAPDEHQFEVFLRLLAGRYLVLFLARGTWGPVVYPDPFASLSAVYSPEHEAVASTTSVLYRDPGSPPTGMVVGEFPDSAPGLFFPAGLTDVPEFRRLMPNHRLCLRTWQSSRFWPRSNIVPVGEGDVERPLSIAVNCLSENLSAAGAVGLPVYAPLTAGRDSRVMLACSSPELRDKTTYVTFRYPQHSIQTKRDVHVARLLAKRYRLAHRILEVPQYNQEERLSYLRRIGRSGGSGKVRDFHGAALQNLDMNAVWLTGFGGEVAISYYSRFRTDPPKPSPDFLLRFLGLPMRADFLAGMECWLHGLPKQCSEELTDALFYMEIRLGCWACPHLYGTAPFIINLIPFSDRRYVESCFALPVSYRRTRLSQVRMIELADAKLLEVPFERFTGWAEMRRRLVHNRFYSFYDERRSFRPTGPAASRDAQPAAGAGTTSHRAGSHQSA